VTSVVAYAVFYNAGRKITSCNLIAHLLSFSADRVAESVSLVPIDPNRAKHVRVRFVLDSAEDDGANGQFCNLLHLLLNVRRSCMYDGVRLS
jgi:hypothetical protein